jgi:predicted glycoside hydrolase/deacetylase ChbG (UPF0249 family)
MGNDMTMENIQKALKKCLQDQEALPVDQSSSTLCRVFEFMVHPGYKSVAGIGGCGEGPDGFSLSEDREHELKILTSDQLKCFLDKEHFALSSFSDIQGQTNMIKK